MDEDLHHENDDSCGYEWATYENHARYEESLNEALEKMDKNQFISALSHEIRDPLAVILAGLSMLEITGVPEHISGAQNLTGMEGAGKHHKILLIEDNKDLTDVLCDIFRAMGHQVHAVHNGTEGIIEARENPPDVIFCDIGIPGLSGYDVAKILKADENLKSTVLIALTGYVGEYYVKKAEESGFDRYLAKPVDKAALERILAEVAG